ncbi:hypothetical protein Pelo_140 [Pelomyxa schiedti]|nr:hypothetical protein Pelo_140 [Pelomyxa schiedti]
MSSASASASTSASTAASEPPNKRSRPDTLPLNKPASPLPLSQKSAPSLASAAPVMSSSSSASSSNSNASSASSSSPSPSSTASSSSSASSASGASPLKLGVPKSGAHEGKKRGSSRHLTASCGLCRQKYSASEIHPILLSPCGHTVCSVCWTTAQSDARHLCPICRVEVAAWEKNLTTMGLLAVMEDAGFGLSATSENDKGGHNTLRCAECTANEATVWCPNEEIALCAQCDSLVHKLKVNESHKRISLALKPKQVLTEAKCPRHPNKGLDMWSVDHKKLCCLLCKEEDGDDATIRDTAHDEVLDTLLRTSRKIKTTLNSVSDPKVGEDTERRRLKADAVDKQKTLFLSQLDAMEAELSHALTESTKKILLERDKLHQIKDAIQHLRECPNNFSVLQTLTLLQNDEDTQPLVDDFLEADDICLPEPLQLGKLTFVADSGMLEKVLSQCGLYLFPFLELKCRVQGTTATIKLKETTTDVSIPKPKLAYSYQGELLRGTKVLHEWNTKRNTYILEDLSLDTKYVVQVRATVGGPKLLAKQPQHSTGWIGTSFITQPCKVFSTPGKFTFKVPSGVTSINAIAIGGGGAGGSWGKLKPLKGTDGGDSMIEGIVTAGGGKAGSSEPGGSQGGTGTKANGGDGGHSPEDGTKGSHGGGGAAGEGRWRKDGAGRLKYAGCGGRGGAEARSWADQHPVSGKGARMPVAKKSKGGAPGWRYGGGGGGSLSCGGGGGGYSAVENYAVASRQKLAIVVGDGGKPARGDEGPIDAIHVGGPGACGLVAIRWASKHAAPPDPSSAAPPPSLPDSDDESNEPDSIDSDSESCSDSASSNGDSGTGSDDSWCE